MNYVTCSADVRLVTSAVGSNVLAAVPLFRTEKGLHQTGVEKQDLFYRFLSTSLFEIGVDVSYKLAYVTLLLLMIKLSRAWFINKGYC